jgi:GDP-4-dehydro-6-deoxy-D-mannose reductase
MTRALIVGIHSFVGRHLARALASRNVEVVGTARVVSATEAVPYTVRTCDLTDAGEVDALLAACTPDWVINTAGATTVRDPLPMYALHVRGTLNLLSAVAKHAQHSAVVLLGSAAEYGPAVAERLPVQESCPACPNSFFGASKLAQTQAALVAAATWQLRITCLRPFNILGPELPTHYMPSAFAARLRAADRSEPLTLVNGHATRDFVDVRDVAEAICRCAEHPPQPGVGEVYNVASGIEVRIDQVARYLCALAGGYEVQDCGNADSRSGVSRSCGNAQKLKNATGWRTSIGWQQSLRDMWEVCEPSAAAT